MYVYYSSFLNVVGPRSSWLRVIGQIVILQRNVLTIEVARGVVLSARHCKLSLVLNIDENFQIIKQTSSWCTLILRVRMRFLACANWVVRLAVAGRLLRTKIPVLSSHHVPVWAQRSALHRPTLLTWHGSVLSREKIVVSDVPTPWHEYWSCRTEIVRMRGKDRNIWTVPAHTVHRCSLNTELKAVQPPARPAKFCKAVPGVS